MEKVSTIIKEMKKEFPGISGVMDMCLWDTKYEEDEAIHLGDAAEGGGIDGMPACDYYNEDCLEDTYIMGVHKKLRAFLEKKDFSIECYDPGTYYAYRD